MHILQDVERVGCYLRFVEGGETFGAGVLLVGDEE